jgi:hypothetical protein
VRFDRKYAFVGKYSGKAATIYNGGFGASGALPRVKKFLPKRIINTFAGKFVGSPACKPSPRALYEYGGHVQRKTLNITYLKFINL